MSADLLSGAAWSCRPTAPGAAPTPADLHDDAWIPATVPGTAAGALRAAGRWKVPDDRDFDAEDWWFRCRFPGGDDGSWVLRLDGLATLAEVWLNGERVLTSDGMFQPHRIRVGGLGENNALRLGGDNELAIRFAALDPVVAKRHPRPRWRTRLVAQQHLRWYRTTFLGRMPGWAPVAAPVGPWRPVTLTRPSLLEHRLRATCEGDDGVVDVHLRVPSEGAVVVRVGDASVTLPVVDGVAEGSVRVPGVKRWWPHTHGASPRYPVSLDLDGEVVDLGHVGFRTVEADRGDDGFRLVVNGTPVFCRGACWAPPDVVSLNATTAEVRRTLEAARDAGMNMVRILGTMVWENDAFWDICDELGILVWQDCMFANVDPPDDEAWLAAAEAELTAQLGALGGRPSLAVVCGGSEVEQQAAMVGLPADGRAMPLFDTHIPKLVERLGLDVPYVTSSPTGGDLPFRPGAGVAHYYGVGAYLRPLDDARRAGVRFASECLAFATPPERAAVEEAFGTAAVAGHHPRWKWAVPRDNGAPWDFEDVRDHYVRELFGVDPARLRYADPERYLDLGRAAVTELTEHVLTEWRRPASPCAGALVLLLRDLWPGAGWGLLDAGGAPKAPWWAMRRVLAPVTLLATDEGLNGLHLHVVNDAADDLAAAVTVDLFNAAGQRLESGEMPVVVPGRGGLQLSAETAFDGFRDLTYAYRFGPQTYDVIAASLRDTDGTVLSEVVHLVGGPARPVEADLGLRAAVTEDAGDWLVEVATDRFAQRVVIDAGGWRAEDSWFHLAPGATRTVRLRGTGDGPPTGEARALNSTATARLVAR